MKQSTIPLYIRFGDIPPDKVSKVHRSDAIIREEGGVSVWEACEANGRYYPILPEDANEDAIADYFGYLIHSDQPVYLVTGSRLCIEGADREPLLMDDITVIKDITNFYGRGKIIKKDAVSIIERAIDKYKNSQKELDDEGYKIYKQVIDTMSGLIQDIIKEDK